MADLDGDTVNLLAILSCGLSDYTTDQRGDVGSLARLEALRYTKAMFDAHPGLKLRKLVIQEVLPLIAKLAAEKLDKVRHQAWMCLESWWESIEDSKDSITSDSNSPSLPSPTHKISHMSETSSFEYFTQLLSLAHTPTFRLLLLQGLTTSACAGTETLIRTTRDALVSHLLDSLSDPSYPPTIHETLNTILERTLTDDRYAIPSMETLGFLLSQNLLSSTAQKPAEDPNKRTFTLVQKAHFKSSNVGRIEAAIKAYEGLLFAAPEGGGVRRDVVRKLTGMLLHPYPKVRNLVADTLFVFFGHEGLRTRDWGAPVKELKGEVEGLRDELLKVC